MGRNGARARPRAQVRDARRPASRNPALALNLFSPVTDLKLSDSGVRRGTCMVPDNVAGIPIVITDSLVNTET